ncbi:hypothetical protein VTK56DRAFT_8658 [Thermocarpiscus australiensis]
MGLWRRRFQGALQATTLQAVSVYTWYLYTVQTGTYGRSYLFKELKHAAVIDCTCSTWSSKQRICSDEGCP